jgi:hypothetical protein
MKPQFRKETTVRWLWMTLGVLAVASSIVALPNKSGADDFTVYSVYNALNLGNPGEIAEKDYYVNMGKSQGVHDGSVLEVTRKIATYDLLSERLYKEMSFPIAKLKVIHTEGNAAIARLDKFLPPDKTPVVSPRAVMVGDYVKISE